jgi:LytTr DNA-binding domain-containing protein
VTDGGRDVTSGGGKRHSAALAWLAFAAIGAVSAAVTALSVIDDRARVGRPVQPWEPWGWELTSLAAWLLLAPLAFAAAARLRPPRIGWPAALAAHAGASVLVSLCHVGLMVALRRAVYAGAGSAYGGGALSDVLLYEYRKDVVTYAALVLLFVLIERLRQPAPPVQHPSADARVEVRDGSRIVWLAPADIEWAQAAGNYVELHGAFGTLLHRKTLAALEQELEPHGFRRIHRSRIVRAATVRAVETRPTGDFDLILASGERISGSRRFRERVA